MARQASIPLTPEQRSLIASVAGLANVAQHGAKAIHPAHAGRERKRLERIDPDGILAATDPAELELRLAADLRREMTELAYKSSRRRQQAMHALAEAEAAEAKLNQLQ
jgi:hypothetical protein